MLSKRKTGDWGEELIARLYEARGYGIVARNYRCRSGEIDLLCSRKNILYSVEIKTRNSEFFGFPEESVSARKKERWVRCTYYFLDLMKKTDLLK